jgi:hypothetical protein
VIHRQLNLRAGWGTLLCTSLINMHKIDEVDGAREGIDNATSELATGEPGAMTWDVGVAWVGDDSATQRNQAQCLGGIGTTWG